MDRFGIHDPVRRRCNILAWVRGHYQDRGEDHGELYEALIAEQLRWGASLTRKVTLDREGALADGNPRQDTLGWEGVEPTIQY